MFIFKFYINHLVNGSGSDPLVLWTAIHLVVVCLSDRSTNQVIIQPVTFAVDLSIALKMPFCRQLVYTAGFKYFPLALGRRPKDRPGECARTPCQHFCLSKTIVSNSNSFPSVHSLTVSIQDNRSSLPAIAHQRGT